MTNALYGIKILIALTRAGIKTHDRELGKRVLGVLRRLQSLSQGRTSHLVVDKVSAGGKPGAKAPARTDDPFRHYLTKFRRARNDAALTALVDEAEIRCDIEEGGERDDVAAAKIRAALKDASEPESDEDAMKRCVEWYEGDEPDIAAIKEGDKRLREWVKKARRRHRRNEDTGRPLPAWRGWDDATRTAQVRELWEQGRTQVYVAEALGISTRTINPYWPGRQAQKRRNNDR